MDECHVLCQRRFTDTRRFISATRKWQELNFA
jgi:hypothetical protein